MTMIEQQQQEARNWAMLCHLASFAGYVVPFGNIIGPLVIWLIKKDTMPFVDAHGKEAVNFQISLTIYVMISFILIFALVGLALVPILLLVGTILTVLAAVEASKGNMYRYPLTIRFVT